MKILIYIGDLVTDIPGIFLGGLMADHLNAEINLLYITPKKRKKKKALKDGDEILAEASQKLSGHPAQMRVRRGNVAKQILNEVQETRYDLVIITASRIGGYPLDLSVTRETLSKLPCSVLIAKNPKPEIRRILMLTGGQPVAESMIKFGARLAQAVQANVTLLHVAANVPTMYTGLHTIEETLGELIRTDTPVAKHLRKCARILSEHAVTSELKLRHGEAVYEIVREIDLGEYDLVILGASGATTVLKEWFLGNVTKDIIDLVGIPVLVVNQTSAENSVF